MKQTLTFEKIIKPDRFSLTILISFLILQTLTAQHISVESFTKLENDMDARVHHPKRDQNGELTAIIKVVTTETGFSFDGGTLGIVATEQKVAEMWVYLPRGAQRITIMHPNLGVLRNYAYPISIEAATVYEMRLITGRIETTVIPPELESQWLLITTEPNTALIYLNDAFEATGTLQKRLLPGSYTYRVENNLYHTEAGRITVTSDKRAELNVNLKPNFGFIEVKSTPETGARVLIEGNDAGFTTNGTSQRLRSGEYTVTVIKEQFQPSSRQITVKDNETTSLTLNMAPNFATVEVKLPSDASLFINNERRSTGNWSGRLNAGVYTFEARKDNHRPAKQDMQLQVGDSRSIELEPQPITGSLDVVTNPPMASVKLNGNDYGTTPNTIRDLLIGEYTVLLEKQGHASVSKSITVTEGGSTLVNETLESGKEVTFMSEPTGARLYLNGQHKGKTPLTLNLSFGWYILKMENNTRVVEESINLESVGKNIFKYDLVEFKCGTDKLIDTRDGNEYETVQIDNQCWMKENLKWLPSVSPSKNGSNNSAHYYVYGYQGSSVSAAKATPNYRIYGVLYSWTAAKNACPQGWRLPSNRDWTVLIDNLGGSSVEGGKMKTSGTTHWTNPNTGATNSSGFSGLPGGRILTDGSFLNIGYKGDWWLSTEFSSDALHSSLFYDSDSVFSWVTVKDLGFSVRCLSYDLTPIQSKAVLYNESEKNNYIENAAGLKLEMVFVEGGTFIMGCTDDQYSDCWDPEKPTRRIIVDDFYIGKYEVTVAQFKMFIDQSNYITDADKRGNSLVHSETGLEARDGVNWKFNSYGSFELYLYQPYPVIYISWNDAVAFCKWLSTKTGYKYRLPTETEWEFAAKGGVQSKGYRYAGSNEIDEVAWHSGNSRGFIHSIGKKKANELGIYDMSGNVLEWCEDDYHENYYGAPMNSTAWIDNPRGDSRVIRGGAINTDSRMCDVFHRSIQAHPETSIGMIGFRLVRSVD